MFIIFLKRHGWRSAICILFSVAAAIGITSMLQKQWPATLLLQVGQIGQTGVIVQSGQVGGQTGGQASFTLLADPNNIVQRVKFPGFVQEVVSSQNLSEDPSAGARAALLKASLTARLVKGGGELVELSVKGYSADEATENLRAAFKIIASEHAQLLAPSLTRLKRNLADTILTLKNVGDERQAILASIKVVNNANNIDKKFSESLLLTNMMKANDTEARNLRDQQSALEEQLSPDRTFNTKALTPIYTPQNSIFPKRSIALILGLFFGIFVGAIWAMWKDKELRVAVGGFFR